MGAIPNPDLERSYPRCISTVVSLYSFFLSLTAICQIILNNDVANLLVLAFTASITLADVFAVKQDIYGSGCRLLGPLPLLIITYDKPDQKVIYAKIDSLAFGARGPGLIQTNLNSNSKVPCWEFDLAKGYPDVGGWKQWKLKYSQPRKRARRKDCKSKSCPRGSSKIKLYLILLALVTAITLTSAYYTDACVTSQSIYGGVGQNTSCSLAQPTTLGKCS